MKRTSIARLRKILTSSAPAAVLAGGVWATAAARRRAKDLSRRAARLHRHVLEPDVLADALPIYAATLAYRSGRPDARAREQAFARASPQYAEAGDGVPASFEPAMRRIEMNGLAWWVPLTRPQNAEHVGRYIAKQDFPFRAITQTREVGLGGVMLDVGANIGRMSIPRVILGDVRAAYCAEPDPLNYACLVRNVRDNNLRGLVMPDQVAIGSIDGTATLERRSSSGGHRVVETERRSRRECLEVPSLTLDTWIRRLGLDAQDISFVKVDAQGSEVHVLRGARRLLDCPQIAWQIEIDAALLAARGCAVEELFVLIGRAGTHFIDLRRDAQGPRVRATSELAEALGYVLSQPGDRTDILTFTTCGPEGPPLRS